MSGTPTRTVLSSESNPSFCGKLWCRLDWAIIPIIFSFLLRMNAPLFDISCVMQRDRSGVSWLWGIPLAIQLCLIVHHLFSFCVLSTLVCTNARWLCFKVIIYMLRCLPQKIMMMLPVVPLFICELSFFFLQVEKNMFKEPTTLVFSDMFTSSSERIHS